MSSRAIAAPCLGQGSRNFLGLRLCLIERQGDHCVGYVRLATINLNRTAAVGVRVSREFIAPLGHIHHAYDDLGRRQRQLLQQSGGDIVMVMASRRGTDPVPDLFAVSTKVATPQRAVPEAEIAPTVAARYLLPKDLPGALTRLSDAEIDALLTASTEEARRRGRLSPPRRPDADQQIKRDAPGTRAKPVGRASSPGGNTALAVGKANAVRAAFMAGVKPSTIARQFGISQSAVKLVLAQIGRARKL